MCFILVFLILIFKNIWEIFYESERRYNRNRFQFLITAQRLEDKSWKKMEKEARG